jgi:hypothetical protein
MTPAAFHHERHFVRAHAREAGSSQRGHERRREKSASGKKTADDKSGAQCGLLERRGREKRTFI